MDKIRIAEELDNLAFTIIEGGWPGSNPKDREFFEKINHSKLKNSKIAAFSMTRRPNISASQDSNLLALLKSKAQVITIVGKTWDFHVTEVLKTTLDENLKMIFDSINFLVKKGFLVFYDAEHFFDAYNANKEYALKTLNAAQDAGCSAICLCDTNGGSLTSQISSTINQIKGRIKVDLGIHCHNDAGLAVANSLAAVESGARIVQGTINGYGERCGNADLIPIIANLKTKLKIDCVSDAQLKELTHLSHFVSEISNMRAKSEQPFVGDSAFAHKGGMHINAIMKNPRTYEHLDPQLVGNRRRILVSELGGKTGILLRAKDLNYDLSKTDSQTKKILELVQSLEHQGFQFEAAEASFQILMQRSLKKYKKFFELEGFRVVIEKSGNKKLPLKLSSN